jgi:hypothetical protein
VCVPDAATSNPLGGICPLAAIGDNTPRVAAELSHTKTMVPPGSAASTFERKKWIMGSPESVGVAVGWGSGVLVRVALGVGVCVSVAVAVGSRSGAAVTVGVPVAFGGGEGIAPVVGVDVGVGSVFSALDVTEGDGIGVNGSAGVGAVRPQRLEVRAISASSSTFSQARERLFPIWLQISFPLSAGGSGVTGLRNLSVL